MVTLPAFLQGVANPVPRAKHPDWVLAYLVIHSLISFVSLILSSLSQSRRKRELEDPLKQQSLSAMFSKMKENGVSFRHVGGGSGDSSDDGRGGSVEEIDDPMEIEVPGISPYLSLPLPLPSPDSRTWLISVFPLALRANNVCLFLQLRYESEEERLRMNLLMRRQR